MGRARRQSQAARTHLLAMYERGDTWQEMATVLGLTLEGVRDRLVEAGAPFNRRPPRWEVAQHWPWPLSLSEVAQRFYGQADAGARRRARTLVGNWLARGWLVRVGWGRYGLSHASRDDQAHPGAGQLDSG